MYKRIEIAQRPKTARIYAGSGQHLNNGPVMTGDTVTVEVADDITFEIKVDEIHESDIHGVLVAIGRFPRLEWETWKLGDAVAVEDEYVSVVSRCD
jgi:hypothetical protein